MNNIRFMAFTLLALYLGLNLSSGLASSKEKEKRWADQIIDGLVVGDAEWLEVGSDKFLGIYAEYTTDKPKGGVIILHGIGIHPDWPDVINPLRSELPDAGWSTLSIQLPILGNEAELKEYAPLFKEAHARINRAVAFLKAKKLSTIAIVGHSLGASMAISYLASSDSSVKDIKTFIGIGISIRDKPVVEMDTLAQLAKVKTPLLDLYGSQDIESVLNTVDARKAALRSAGNPMFRQDMVPGANHFFRGLSPDLIRRVRSWLDRTSKQ